jgi:hypothetical protein
VARYRCVRIHTYIHGPPNSMDGQFFALLSFKHPGPFHIRTRDHVFATCNDGSLSSSILHRIQSICRCVLYICIDIDSISRLTLTLRNALAMHACNLGRCVSLWYRLFYTSHLHAFNCRVFSDFVAANRPSSDHEKVFRIIFPCCTMKFLNLKLPSS